MLRRRPIDRFRIVSILDDALDAVPDKVMKEYTEGGRDWKIIEPHIVALNAKPLEERAQVYHCDPLRPAYDGISLSQSVGDFKSIFAAHVKHIDNLPEDMPIRMTRRDENSYLELEYVDQFPLAVVIDIAAAIVRSGQGDTSPFSPPDGFWAARARRFARHRVAMAAKAASIETATADSTRSENDGS
jgi:hypothetical protein